MTATHPTKATRRSDFNSFSQKCLLIQINNLISIFKHGLNIQVTNKIPHMNQFYVLAHPLLWLLQLPLWPEQIGSSATSNINEQLYYLYNSFTITTSLQRLYNKEKQSNTTQPTDHQVQL